jgi:hypothetical protein
MRGHCVAYDDGETKYHRLDDSEEEARQRPALQEGAGRERGRGRREQRAERQRGRAERGMRL